MSTAEDVIKLRHLVADHRIAMVSTSAPTGELHSRPVKTQEIDDEGSFWFMVSARAAWVAGLSADEPVNLGYTDSDDKTWVSVAGTVRMVEDGARVDRYRGESDKNDHRIDDADVRLLVVRPSTVEYWDTPSGKLQALAMKAAKVIGRDSGDSSGTISLG
jgi:general stress protein 26